VTRFQAPRALHERNGARGLRRRHPDAAAYGYDDDDGDDDALCGRPQVPQRRFRAPQPTTAGQGGGVPRAQQQQQQQRRKPAPPPGGHGGGGSRRGPQNNAANNAADDAAEAHQQQQQKSGSEQEELPERLKGCDPELVKRIENEIMDCGLPLTFEDVAGLDGAKRAITEMVIWPMRRPDLFVGLRRLAKGMLLFGPPGTGKTMIGRAIASSCDATFFAISASSLTSKWIGESEKLVRTLFAVAGHREPSIVFVDEVDSLLSQRSADENEASRRLKTEFLVQLEGVDSSKAAERVLVVGATNKPHELDEAARRRFVKRFYVPLPDAAARRVLFRTLLAKNQHALTAAQIDDDLVTRTDGFSGADCRNLCQEAAMGPVRDVGAALFGFAGGAPSSSSSSSAAAAASSSSARRGDDHQDASAQQTVAIPPITFAHFEAALAITRPTVAPSDLAFYEDWDRQFGTQAAGAAPAAATTTDPAKRQRTL